MTLPPNVKDEVTDSDELEVWVAGIRILESYAISAVPSDEASKEFQIWNFFQRLVGLEPGKKITSIRTFPPENGKACECDAEPGDGGRLKRACVCPGGKAIVCFKNKAAATTLKGAIKSHFRTHEHGVVSRSSSGAAMPDKTGRVDMCQDCCLNMKQVYVSTTRPSHEPAQGEDPLSEIKLDLDRTNGTRTLLAGLLGLRAENAVASFVENYANQKLETVREAMLDLVSNFAKDNPDRFPDREKVLSIAKKGWLTIIEGGINCEKEILNFIEQVDRLEQAVNAKKSPKAVDKNKEKEVISVENDDDDLGEKSNVEKPEKAKIDPSEANVKRYLDRLEENLEDYSVEYVIGLKGEEVLSKVQLRLTGHFDVIDSIFASVDIPVEVENKFKSNFRAARKKYETVLSVITNGLELEKSKNNAISNPGSGGDYHKEAAPDAEEVDHQLRLFTAYRTQYRETKNQVEIIIGNEDVRNMKMDFQAVQQTMEPQVGKILKQIGEIADIAKKWLKVSDDELSTANKEALTNCVREYQRFQRDWQKTSLEISRADSEFKFSRKTYDGAAAGIVKSQKVDIFWNQENGKKFQSLLDWFTQLESKILLHFPSSEQKIEQVIDHLSPKIAAVAKVQRFRTYEDIKKWLKAEYLDEDKVLEFWQSELTNVKVNTPNDVPLYIEQVKGILCQIIESAGAGKSKLVSKLFSPENMSYLIIKILDPLSKPTKLDQVKEFMTREWAPIVASAEAAGEIVEPEVMMKCLEKRLNVIKQVSKVEIGMRKDAETKMRLESGDSKEAKKLVQIHQEFIASGANDPWGAALRKFAQTSAAKDKGHAQAFKNKEKATGYHIVEVSQRNGIVHAQTMGTNIDLLRKHTRKRDQITRPITIQVNQESLTKAKDWEGQYKLRCWVCPDEILPHEFVNCGKGLSATNKTRYLEAKNPKQGGGLQCFTCLKASCFAKRCLAIPAGEKRPLGPCQSGSKESNCRGCADDIRALNKPGSENLAPLHVVICTRDPHLKGINRTEVLKGLAKLYGADIKRVTIHTYTVPVEKLIVDNKYGVNHQNERTESFKVKPKNKSDDSRPKPPVVSEDEYKGPESSLVFDTCGGDTSEIEPKSKNNGKSLVSAPEGAPVYFMQQLNLSNKPVLVFYDSGAMLNLIVTELARKLGLKMVNRNGLHLIGAGNKLTVTKDGKYELLLGKSPRGEIFKIIVAGMPELTGPMLQANWDPIHEQVKEQAKKIYNDSDKEIRVEPNEVLPPMVGGQVIKIIIGLTLPVLQPRVIFYLPGGLLVARSQLKDIWGSTIVFGGVHDRFEHFYTASYLQHMNVKEVDRYKAYGRFCMNQYISFRDSVRQDAIFLKEGKQGHEDVKKWNKILEDDDEKDLIIADSEDKRSVQLSKKQNMKQLVRDDERFLFEKYRTVESPSYPEIKELKNSKKVRWGDLNMQLYKAPEEATGCSSKYDMLCGVNTSGTLGGGRLSAIDEAISTAFGAQYATSADEGEEVLFENEDDKQKCLAAIMKSKSEATELIRKNLDSKTSASAGSDRSSGMPGGGDLQSSGNPLALSVTHSNPSTRQLEKASFEAVLKRENYDKDILSAYDQISNEHTCESCNCSTKDIDTIFEEVEDQVINIDRKSCQKIKQALRTWEEEDATGTGIDYRCSKCAGCKECLKSGRTRARSVREDDEQNVIESSVRIDWENKVCFVFLPWIKSPQELALRWGADSNIRQARHFLRKMLQKSEKDRKSLVDFWEELKKRDVVCKLKDLSEKVQQSIANAPVKHFYPWNCVFKESITTPCRMVVDSRCSGLNEHLAKGHNTLNNLQMLLIRFRSYKFVGSYDISKMYNMLRIEESHLQYQLILWVDEMDPCKEVEVWVMTRAIYGTISSGNQAEVAIRRGASVMETKYPEGAFTIIHETYVDDGVPGRDEEKLLIQALEEVEIILNMIGFSLKCTTRSRQSEELNKKASSDGISIGIAGYNWKPKTDKIGLAMKECNFNPNIRGAKAPNKHKVVKGEDIDDEIFPQELTRAQVVGKVAELFDLIGIFMPITVEGKIMARKVAHLDWKDVIPKELMEDWKKFVRKVQDTRNIEIDRCVIPEEVVDGSKFDVFEVHDGSQHSAAATIYARTKSPTGDLYNSRLLFSRSMLCPPEQSIPRNELQAAHLGAVTNFITRVALKEKIGKIDSFGDSRVTLCWVMNPELKLKNWCFARVQEIHRISGEVEYYWVKGENNIADLATKGQVTVEDVSNQSDWQRGMEWMHSSIEELQNDEIILNFKEVMVKLDAKDQSDLGQEQHPTLPDLAVGGRKDANPELDIDILQISTPSLLETNIYQLLDFQRPTEGLPKLKIADDGFYCFSTQISTEHNALQDVKSGIRGGASGLPVTSCLQRCSAACKTVGDFGFGKSRNRLPNDEKLLSVPEIHSGLISGFSPKEISSALINYPANFSLVVGGMQKDRLKICGYLMDPIYYGWRRAFKVTAVCVKFIWMLKHRAHQIPKENRFTSKQIQTRKKLMASCSQCKQKLNTESVNLAYLDALTTGISNVNKYDQLVRNQNKTVWKPSTVYATTRAKAKLRREREKSRAKNEIWQTIEIDDKIKVATWNYFMRIASQEVDDVLNNKDKKMFNFDKEQKIWKYYGRLMERTDIEIRDIEVDEFFDGSRINYVQPVGLATSPFVYSIVMDLHWRVFPHKGVQATQRLLAQILYVIKGGNLVRAIREDCQQCRRILKKAMQEKMGEIPLEKLIISPAFYAVQIDHCGPFLAYSKHNQRSTITIDALVITCINTSAVSINALETLEAPSIIKSLLRHSCRYGYPYVGFIDQGPGLVKACNTDFNLMTHASVIKNTVGMRVVAKPTQAHESRGKVERAVQALKNFLQDNKYKMTKQSILDWETTFLYVSNFMNNLPVARLVKKDSMTSDVNEILTPNRLLLGRNNDRSPCFVDDCESPTYSERLLRNSAINRAWFTLLTKLTPTLTYRPKWHNTSSCPPVIGDFVLFLHKESRMGPEHEEWRPGKIYDIGPSESSNTLIYYIEYRIVIRRKGQKVEDAKVECHSTSRVLRDIVLLYSEEELSSLHGSPEHLKRLSKKL